MERFFIDANFHYIEIVEVKNGDGWSLEQIAEQVATKFYIKNMNADLVVVWLDKEKHPHSCQSIEEIVLSKLIERGADSAKTIICVPDRMTENMILADEEAIRAHFDVEDYQYSEEGKNGKFFLAQMHERAGINYKETTHGVALLKKIRLVRAAKKSAAAASLLQGITFPCWWKDQGIT